MENMEQQQRDTKQSPQNQRQEDESHVHFRTVQVQGQELHLVDSSLAYL